MVFFDIELYDSASHILECTSPDADIFRRFRKSSESIEPDIRHPCHIEDGIRTRSTWISTRSDERIREDISTDPVQFPIGSPVHRGDIRIESHL